jgi:hypothetical protein
MTEYNMINTCREVAKKLVNLNNVSDISRRSEDSLLFPKYGDEIKTRSKIRISEQESKILFSNYFHINKTLFSIEVPTVRKFCFKGKTGIRISARYDLATYASIEDILNFDWIIELKAHNPIDNSIRKDLEKMATSNHNCVWFHTLKNEDKATIPSILKKFKKSFEDISKIEEISVSSKKLLLVFVVIDKKLLYSAEFQFDKWNSDLPTNREELNKENLI